MTSSVDIVLGDELESVEDALLGLFTDDGVSGEDPDVLLGEEGSETDTAVDDSVVVVVGTDDLVVTSGDVGFELNFEVTSSLSRTISNHCPRKASMLKFWTTAGFWHLRAWWAAVAAPTRATVVKRDCM